MTTPRVLVVVRYLSNLVRLQAGSVHRNGPRAVG